MNKIKQQKKSNISNPLVSVVMPVYNSAQYLEASIESVLNQSYKNFEFLIINDGSVDASLKIIKKYQKQDKRIILLNNIKNKGVIFSLNKGVKQSKGKYIIRMDADDWAYPDRFKEQVKLMENNPKVVVSGSYIEVCDENLSTQYVRKYQLNNDHIRSRIFRYSPFAHPATIWRSDEMKKELYNPEAINTEDYELYFRIGKHGEFKNLDKILLKLRLHDSSVSASMNDSQSKMTIAIRLKAVKDYNYKMTLFDRIYNILQSMLIGLIPVKYRFLIFNQLRNFDFY